MTMLDRMRRHKGWLKWSLALVVLAFVVFYVPDFLDQDPSAAGVAPREAVAEVNGHRITAAMFQQRYFSQLQRFRTELGGSISDQLLRQLGIDQQILGQLVDEQVALIEAQRHGITVSDEELRQQIYALPVFQENGEFIGRARYEEMLRMATTPLTPQTFEEGLRRDLVLSKLRAALTDWMTVSDEELEREYRQRNERIRLEMAVLTADEFRDRVTVSDDDVAAYFESRQAEYRVGEQRRIRYVLVDRDQERQQVNVTFDDVQRFYDDNSGLYQMPERVRARHILFDTTGRDEQAVRQEAEAVLEQAREGADFEALAREHSDDTGTRDRGGDLDYFPRGQMVPEFETAAFALAPGQLSDLVRSQFGFHIIQLVDRQPEQVRPLEDARGEIEEQLLAQRTEQRVQERAGELARRVHTADDLQTAAEALGLRVEESGDFQREDPVPGLGAAPQVAATAFQLGEGAVSDAIPTPRGPAVITVSARRDPYVPDLDEVRGRVREDLVRTRAGELSRARAAELSRAVQGGQGLEAAARALGADVELTDWITRDSPLPAVGFSPEIDRAAFALPEGGVSEPIEAGEATVVVRVAEREEVTPERFQQARETFRAELLNERRARFFTAYMSRVRTRMDIRTYPEVVQRIAG
jgi:peptidyl-prolyl cis-trans isomerase D